MISFGRVVPLLCFNAAAFLYLYGLEHELSVVKGPQVFGDIQPN